MPNTRTYPSENWIDPRVEVRPSPIHGLGLFVRPGAEFAEGEVVIRFGGTVVRAEEATPDCFRPRSLIGIADGYYLGTPVTSLVTPDEYLNHSCDPNVWMLDEVTVVARRPIAAEELTCDWSMWFDDDAVMTESCRCGSPLCRRRVTAKDWMLKELQQHYGDHFCPFINQKIQQLTKKSVNPQPYYACTDRQ